MLALYCGMHSQNKELPIYFRDDLWSCETMMSMQCISCSYTTPNSSMHLIMTYSDDLMHWVLNLLNYEPLRCTFLHQRKILEV